MQNKQKINKTNDKIKKLLDKMEFFKFKNNKKYSFNYPLKKEFEKVTKEAVLELEGKESLSTTITNYIPIFLPKETRRIAFFQSTSKSVRRIPIKNIIKALQRNSHNYNIQKDDQRDIDEVLQNDIKTFESHLKEYDKDEYYIDTFSTSIRFNAYDKDDNLLLEKSYVRGGLVFDMNQKEFEENVIITYPNYRKKRSDTTKSYLDLSLLKIRPLQGKNK